MADKPVFTLQQVIDQISRWDVQWPSGATVYFTFPEATPADRTSDPDFATFKPVGADRRAAAREVFRQLNELTNLNFVEKPDDGSSAARIILSEYGDIGTKGLSDSGGGIITAGRVFFGTANGTPAEAALGQWAFSVVLHEMGHVLGLAHPGDYHLKPGPQRYDTHADYMQDSRRYTVMSYWDWNLNPSGGRSGTAGVQTTYMMHDIATLQALYGADYTTRAGDTVYGFNSNAGAAYDFGLIPNAIFSIWDGGGNDTLDLSRSPGGVRVSLEAGAFSDTQNLPANVTIAYGVVIENAIGGSAADFIVGNSAANRLTGLASADTLVGGAGSDTLDGGEGADALVGGADADTLTGGAGADELYGQAGADRLEGGAEADVVYGGAEADAVFGGSGDDLLNGELGDDTMDGGEGADLVTGEDGGDLIYGSSGDDVLLGGAGDDALNGQSENDALFGEAGKDFMTGEAGADILFGGLDADTAHGGTGADSLNGEAGDDVLLGAEDADVLSGEGGADRLVGGSGADVLLGGAGADVFVFEAVTDSLRGLGGDLIVDFAGAEDKVDLAAVDANALAAGDQAFVFAAALTGVAGQATLTFSAATGRTTFAGDVDGDGVADLLIVLQGQVGQGAWWVL